MNQPDGAEQCAAAGSDVYSGSVAAAALTAAVRGTTGDDDKNKALATTKSNNDWLVKNLRRICSHRNSAEGGDVSAKHRWQQNEPPSE